MAGKYSIKYNKVLPSMRHPRSGHRSSNAHVKTIIQLETAISRKNARKWRRQASSRAAAKPRKSMRPEWGRASYRERRNEKRAAPSYAEMHSENNHRCWLRCAASQVAAERARIVMCPLIKQPHTYAPPAAGGGEVRMSKWAIFCHLAE